MSDVLSADAKSTIELDKSLETGLKRVFIVGCVRSGTTWMMWLLAHHPETVVAQQPATFSEIEKLRTWLFTGSKVAKNVIAINEHSRSGQSAGFVRVELKELLETAWFNDLNRALQDEVFRRMASINPRARVVVDQTPEHIEVADSILNAFPDAYFIHMIRDPRDVAASANDAIKSWGAGFPRGRLDIARHWRSCIEGGRALATRTRRYREVRYEDLLSDGPKILGELHDWLELPTDVQRCEDAVQACRIDKLRAMAPSPVGFFQKGVAGRWRNDLSASHVKAIEFVAGDLMEDYGYQQRYSRSTRLPLGVRLHESAWAASRSVVRAIRRALVFNS